MSRLEKTVWKQTEIPLAICGTLNLPEIISSPSSLGGPLLEDEVLIDENLSPTLSIDSGRSTSTEVWASHKYMLYGGPGFSIATLDSSTGSVSQIPVPVPMSSPSDSPQTQFSLSAVTALDVVGDCQVWAGTESGSLHILELNSEHRFRGHSLTNLSDPITCIHSRQRSSSPGQPSRVDVLVGGSNGNLTILSGQTNQRRGLKNSLKSARKVLPLGGFGGNETINSVTFVTIEGVEMCWCACGMSIVVLRCSDWNELARFSAHSESPPEELVSSVAVSSLLSCEMGVWSSLSRSSAVTLWDKQKLSPKMTIVCWDSYSSAGWLMDSSAQISALSYFHPLLFAGTKGGHLMVFRTNEDKTGHRLVAGTHCSSSPIVDIHPTPLETDFPSPATPTPAVNVLVICGDSSMSNGSAQLFELISSPYQSPITSPAVSISGRVSVSSTASTPSSLSLRRLSANDYGSLPPLDLAGAFHNSRTLLPLRAD